jgi:lipopolysaccharide/colanic/teichoic acid biosynthesis glycosyltransferase
MERGLALFLLLLSVPVLVLVGLGVFFADGRPIFYSGSRLGRRKKVFSMLKFRTLAVGAQQVTGARLFDHSFRELPIRAGKFLRDTRVDELPQLLNVVRGEMSFVGPRPERPEVYEEQCWKIDGYDLRFSVRPGMIGYSQLFTPHGTHKRYRALIDNAGIRRRKSGFGDLAVVAYTVVTVLRKIVACGARHLREALIQARLRGLFRQKRRLRRIRPQYASAFIVPARNGGSPRRAALIDINEEAVLVRCCDDLGDGMGAQIRLEIDLPPHPRAHGGRRIRSASFKGYITHRRTNEAGQFYVLRLRPMTPRSDYILHQYFLRSSLAPPPSLREPKAPAGRNGSFVHA